MGAIIEAVDVTTASYNEQTEFADITLRDKFDHPGLPDAQSLAFLSMGLFQGHGAYGLSYADMGAGSTKISKEDVAQHQGLGQEVVESALRKRIPDRIKRMHDKNSELGNGGAVGATVAAYNGMLYLAHVGDIQAWYVSTAENESGGQQNLRLATPHDASNQAEIERFNAAGEQIETVEGKRLFMGKWPASRSIGDHNIPKPHLFPAEAEFEAFKLERPGLLIMATRGVWSAVEPNTLGERLLDMHISELRPEVHAATKEAAQKSDQNTGMIVARFAVKAYG